MPEKPSLETIKKITLEDIEFEKRLLVIIKRELPQEIEKLNANLDALNYIEAAQNVHKLNHKINIFGLVEGSRTADKFQNELRAGNSEKKKEFNAILEEMTLFLNSL